MKYVPKPQRMRAGTPCWRRTAHNINEKSRQVAKALDWPGRTIVSGLGSIFRSWSRRLDTGSVSRLWPANAAGSNPCLSIHASWINRPCKIRHRAGMSSGKSRIIAA